MKPIERLFERDGLPLFGLPAALAESYGGDFGLARPGLYANFVSSTDGVVALAGKNVESGALISGNSQPDRFVMALLRTCADAVLIGAGTFRKADGDLWHAESVYPDAAAELARLRRQLDLRPQPMLVVVTASGQIDPSQPALRDALIVTTQVGEAHLRGKLPTATRVAVVDAEPISGRTLMDVLEAENLNVVLAEGGPTLLGQLVREDLVDELFLTTSPRLFGRTANDGRKSLIDGVDLVVDLGVDLGGQSLELLSVRRHESHLFLRYAFV